MESHRPRSGRTRGRKEKVKAEAALVTSLLPYLADLIGCGEITIGMLLPDVCVATAADEECAYAILVRRRGETLGELLRRLDRAVDKTMTLGVFTDEINR